MNGKPPGRHCSSDLPGRARESAVSGDVRPLPEIMASLRRTMASGRLKVNVDTATRELLFARGELMAVRSSEEDEKLGSWLVRKGVVSSGHMALGLLAQVGETASPLGHILVKRRLVAQADLEKNLEELAFAIVERAASAENREAVFVEGGTDQQPDTLLTTSTQQLILVAARATTDEKAMRRLVGSLQRPARLCAPLDSIMFDGSYTTDELALMQGLESAPTVAELRSTLGMKRTEFASALCGLVVSGYVVLGERPAVRKDRTPSTAKIVPNRPGETPANTILAKSPAGTNPVDVTEAVRAELKRHEELLRVGNVPGAFHRLERACEIDPAPENLVRLSRFMREHDTGVRRILETLRLALETDPRQVEGWVELARYWRRHGSPERQRKALTRALYLDPDHDVAVVLLKELDS